MTDSRLAAQASFSVTKTSIFVTPSDALELGEPAVRCPPSLGLGCEKRACPTPGRLTASHVLTGQQGGLPGPLPDLKTRSSVIDFDILLRRD